MVLIFKANVEDSDSVSTNMATKYHVKKNSYLKNNLFFLLLAKVTLTGKM